MAAPDISGLWPTPRHLRITGENLSLSLAPVLTFSGPATDAAAAALGRWEGTLEGLGYAPTTVEARSVPSATIQLRIDPVGLAGAESYRLEVGPEGISATGADERGLFYAACTLGQWSRAQSDGPGAPIPGLRIDDHPSFAHRGVLLDVSRNRVPTMDTLFELVEHLADWKINQLQLYTEHTFAYRGHERVWRDASPFTPSEMRELDVRCRERMIELVPNQNSFGHFHRWLVHEPYRRLAECPEGVSHPFSDTIEPFSLCPIDPGATGLLADLYDQLLPNFTSSMMNVGLDETFDLGLGRSAEVCAERGKASVYLEYLRTVHGMLADRGHRLQFWGDIVLDHPELIPDLPPDAIPLAWGYEADHPFGEQLPRFAESGLDFYVCPGTSSWNSLGGRSRNALGNLANAAVAGQEAGALGYLITDWGDFGHLQPFSVSWPGFLAGAGFAWNSDAAREADSLDLAGLLGREIFGGDEELGHTLLELGDVHRLAGREVRNGTPLFFLLIKAHESLEHGRYDGLEPAGLARAGERLEELSCRLSGQGFRTRENRLTTREIGWVTALLRLACRIGEQRLTQGRKAPIQQIPTGERRVLAAQLIPTIQELRDLWLARHRAGGMTESTGRLEHLRDLLLERAPHSGG